MPLIHWIHDRCRRFNAAVRAYNLPENSSKPLKERFAAAAKILSAPKDDIARYMVTLPYSYLVELFDFKSDRYVTVPGKQYEARNFFDLPLGQTVNFGPLRVMYANPDQVLQHDTQSNPDTIYPDEIPAPTKSSAVIIGSEDKIHDDYTFLITIIRDQMENKDDTYNNVLFGFYGTAMPYNGGFKFKRIIMPGIDENGVATTELKDIDVNDHDAVSKALTYARLCKEAISRGERPDVRRLLREAEQIPYGSRALPGVPHLPVDTQTKPSGPL